MNFTLSTELPFWLVLICLAAGIGVAMLLYRKNNGELPKTVQRILFVLRALSFSIIAFLLLSPVWKSFDPATEKPIIIIGEDHSSSVKNLTDSVALAKYRRNLNDWISRHEEQFEFHTYSFGEEVREGLNDDYGDRLTDLSEFMDDMEDRHENRNVAFMVLASDGRFNKGQNPIYRKSSFPYPVYTVVMGDTVLRPDFAVTEIRNNKMVFLENQFEVEAVIRAVRLKGRSGQLVVLNNGKEVFQKVIAVNDDDLREKVRFSLPASNPGLQRYEIKLIPFENEINTTNNSRYFFIDVIEDQQKVLILASAPHPDVRALLTAINESRNYKATAAIAKHFRGNLRDYSLLILHQVPSGEGIPEAVRMAADIPVLYVLGKQSSVPEFNNLTSGLKLDAFRGRFNEVTAVINKSFGSFSLGEDVHKFIGQFPPVIAPMATYLPEGDFHTLLYQRIGSVETSYPLMGFYTREQARVGVISGEGLWRWRLYNYRLNGTTEQFDDLIRKCVQFMAIRDTKSRFRITSEPSWFEHENVMFEAEFYDQSYTPDLNQDISLTVTDAEGEKFEYRFLPSVDRYEADLGKLDAGDYRWTARLSAGGESFTKNGSFTIKPLQLELADFQADPNLLYNLSAAHGGEMSGLDHFVQNLDEVLDKRSFQPVLHLKEHLKDLIAFKELFFFLLLLLTAEWAIRKFFGLR